MKSILYFALLTLISGVAIPADGALITFSGPFNITTAAATLDLPGTVVGAATFGGGPTTVTTAQTIVFTADNTGVAKITQSSGSIGNTSGFSGSGNANFDSVLGNFAYDGAPTIAQLQNLTIGTQYQVQLFSLDDRGCCGTRTYQFSDGANFSTTSAENANVYYFGSFTADATSQNIQSIGVAQSQSNFNALVVRTVVPEPASWVLIGLGGISLFASLRRRQAV